MKSGTKFIAISIASFTLAVGLTGLAHADSADPEYASNSCLRDKRPSKVCCEEVLDGDKKEIAECVKLVASKRKNAAEAKAAKKAKAQNSDAPADDTARPAEQRTADSKKSAGKGLRGSWTTEFGDTMIIEQDNPFKARFNLKDGRIVGELKDGTMNGLWIQSSSKSKCTEEREGSFYWGKISLVFSGSTYTGTWGYCDQEPDRKMRPGERKR